MFPKVTARLCHITAVLGESLGDAAQDPIVGDLAANLFRPLKVSTKKGYALHFYNMIYIIYII